MPAFKVPIFLDYMEQEYFLAFSAALDSRQLSAANASRQQLSCTCLSAAAVGGAGRRQLVPSEGA